MRTGVPLILCVLVLACPLLCGAVEACHDARNAHPAAGPDGPSAPAHCPEDADDCVCRGAVRAADVKAPRADTTLAPLESLGTLGLSLPQHVHVASGGPSPPSLLTRGDARDLRAFLQIFRC